MIIDLKFLGDGFVALDQNGVQITDSDILNQLAFEPLPLNTNSFKLLVDNSTKPATIVPLQLNINTHINTLR